MIQNINFKVGGQRIPTVSEEPVKSLVRWFDESLKDINQTKRTLQDGLLKIDHSPFQGKFKVDICSIYLFRCYYGPCVYTNLLQVQLSQWRVR